MICRVILIIILIHDDYLSIVTCMCVTIDGFWIDDEIYWTF
jgi:hypothetical protein